MNVALFGMTAAEWRNANPDKNGNMRDYATIEQLLVLANLENVNALYIGKDITQPVRIEEMNRLARHQLSVITSTNSVKQLVILDEKNTETK